MCRRLSIVFAILAIAVDAAYAEDNTNGYKFTLNGQSFKPEVISLTGRPDRPAPGDLIAVNRLWLALDDERNWNLLTSPREEGLLFRKRGQEREIVAATLETTYRGKDRKLVNPLNQMTKDDKKRLLGVRLETWEDSIAKSLNGVDFSRTALTINDLVKERRNALPSMPDDARYLLIDESSNQGIKNYAKLAGLKSLQVLNISTMTAAVPAKYLAEMKELRHLACNHLDQKGIDGLGALTELRTLQLAFCDGVSDISFVRHCANLANLDVRGTGVTDLRPLNELQHLETVCANNTKVHDLPKRVPNLRRIDLFSTALTDEQTAAFQKDHLECMVRHRWERAMRDAASKVDRIRIRTGGTCHRLESNEKTLLDIKDVKIVKELLATIQIDEKRSGIHCMCCGEPSIEFYEGEHLAMTLGFHHGNSLRWVGNWPGDAVLAGDSGKKLSEWMADRGVKGPLQEIEQSLKLQKEAIESERKWLAAMPSALKPHWATAKRSIPFETDLAPLRKALEAAIADKNERIIALLSWYGSGKGPWSGFPAYEDIAEKLLLDYETPKLLAAIEGRELTTAQIEGLARLFGGWTFSQLRPNDLKSLPPKLKAQLLKHSQSSEDADKLGRARKAFGKE